MPNDHDKEHPGGPLKRCPSCNEPVRIEQGRELDCVCTHSIAPHSGAVRALERMRQHLLIRNSTELGMNTHQVDRTVLDIIASECQLHEHAELVAAARQKLVPATIDEQVGADDRLAAALRAITEEKQP